VLRGVFSAAHYSLQYGKLLDWLVPTHLEKVLAVAQEEWLQAGNLAANGWLAGSSHDAVLDFDKTFAVSIQVLKFLQEILRNEAGRLRQDAQSMNGFLLWKASEKWTSGLLKTLFEQSLALDKRAIEFLLKTLGLASKVLLSCLEGGYINFAICEYYNDRSYTEFLLQYCTCILCIPQECVLSYQKPCERIVRCLCTLFLRQLPMIVTTLDTTLLSQLFFGVMLPALREASEVRSLLIQTLDNFCEATYDQVIVQR
jgi:hypothetical protein